MEQEAEEDDFLRSIDFSPVPAVVPDGCAQPDVATTLPLAASETRNELCRVMARSVLASWRSLDPRLARPPPADVARAPFASTTATTACWREQLLSHVVGAPPFSSSSSSSSSVCDPGGARRRLTKRSRGWAEAVARLRWWALIADGPHSCLAFLDHDDDDDDDDEGDQEDDGDDDEEDDGCGTHVAMQVMEHEERDGEEEDDDKVKEELIGVLCRALGEEKRRGERRWLKAWFGDEWVVPRMWTRLGRAVRRRNMELACELLNTMEWLISTHGNPYSDSCEDRDDRQQPFWPGVAADVLLFDIVKSTTPQHIICKALRMASLEDSFMPDELSKAVAGLINATNVEAFRDVHDLLPATVGRIQREEHKVGRGW